MKKRIAIIVTILLILTVAILVIIIPSLLQRDKLKQEAKALDAVLSEKEVNQDALDEILNRRVTKSGYVVVEDAYKRYSKDLHGVYVQIIEKLSDEKIKQILTIDTYKSDGPEFANTIAYIEQMKNDLKTLNESYYKTISNDNVLSYLPEDFDENYVNYYIEFTQNYVGDNNSKTVEDSINSIISLLDKQLDILNFLKANKKQWMVSDKGLSFATEELTNTFNEKIKNL
jgi:hypothetical protein